MEIRFRGSSTTVRYYTEQVQVRRSICIWVHLKNYKSVQTCSRKLARFKQVTYFRVEGELLLRRSSGDLENRGSTPARRSFFRRKKHQRSGSRDSKELATFTITTGWYSENEDFSLCSYQRVERLDCEYLNLQSDVFLSVNNRQIRNLDQFWCWVL